MTKHFHYILSLMLLTLAFSSQAQSLVRSESSYYFNKADQQINLSVGMINANDFAFSIFGATGAGDPSVSINLSYDYGISDHISIGAFTSYYRVDASYTNTVDNIAASLDLLDTPDFNVNEFLDGLLCSFGINCPETTIEERISVYTIGGKGMIQRTVVPRLSTYLFSYIGYSFNRRQTITEELLNTVADELDLKTEVPRIIYFASAGARYYFTEKLGIFGEYGIGNVHLLQVGVNYKL